MTTPSSDLDVLKLSRAILFALVALVVGLSYLAVRSTLSIDSFRLLFIDMLGGRPLPPLTNFVIGARGYLIALSLAIPIIAIVTLFLKRIVLSFYIVGFLSIATIILAIVIYHGLSAPLVQIVSGLNGTQ